MDSKQLIEAFWKRMESNDFYAVADLMHDDFTLEWHQSGELIRGRENFAKINTAYPANGKWRFNINSIVAEGDIVVTDVSVTDGVVKDRVITFSTIRDEKIWKQVEFWPEPFTAPEWRAQWVEKI
ncbi:MAG: nuclear transport factor 2 family protein [Anaerolineales bacterium]